MTWTDERVSELSRLWAAGYSASAIGRMLGVSKNAVVGKAHRLDLPQRGSPIDYSGKSPEKKARRQAGMARATVQQSEAPVPPAAPESEVSVPLRQEVSAATVARWHISQAQAKAEQDLRRERGQPLLPWAMTRQFTRSHGMRFRGCQWIAGDPKPCHDDACKCGAAVGESRVYCPVHEVKARRTRLAWGEAAA